MLRTAHDSSCPATGGWPVGRLDGPNSALGSCTAPVPAASNLGGRIASPPEHYYTLQVIIFKASQTDVPTCRSNTPGRRRLRHGYQVSKRMTVNRLPEVIEVPGLSIARVNESIRLFGWPAQVCAMPDGEGLALGGPRASNDQWLWTAYAGPSLSRRRQAPCMLDGVSLDAWRERACARGTFDGYLGVRTLAAYYLLAQDAQGPYVTGYSVIFERRPSQPPKLVFRQLARGARWLWQRVNREQKPRSPDGRDGHARVH